MTDEELQSLAAEGNELTDLAKPALQSELKARGLMSSSSVPRLSPRHVIETILAVTFIPRSWS
jgi:hypothetical protein